MVGYYDLVLGAIPASLIGVTLLAFQFGLSTIVAVPLGTGAPMVLMGHAMFVNGPVDDEGRDPVGDDAGATPRNGHGVGAGPTAE